MRIRGHNLRKLGLFRLFLLSVAISVFSLLLLSDARAEILVVDDFENPASSEKLWDQSSDAILNIVTDPAKAHSGSRVNEMVYVPGWNGPGFMNRSFSSVPGVYVRWYEKYSENWVWSPVATKGIFVLAEDYRWGVVTGTNWGESNYAAAVNLEPSPTFKSNVNIQNGQWYCFEMRWTQGGVFQMWIDNVLRIDGSNLGTAPGGATHLTVSGYYNDAEGRSCNGQVPCGVPQLQTRWVDDIVVSTTRIGCLPDTADKTPPSTPTGVRINTQ